MPNNPPKHQKGFSAIRTVVIAVVIFITLFVLQDIFLAPDDKRFIRFGADTITNNTDNTSNAEPRESTRPNPFSWFGDQCKSNPSPTFTHNITDVSKIVNIVIPPNFVAGDLKTHSYIETDHAKVPVYAPADMTLTGGSYYISGPYRLDFQVSCEVTMRFAHITEPIQEIKNILPSTPAPANNSRDQAIKNQISFKAGDLIGYTTGTDRAGNWDFGVYNANTKNKYADDEKLNFSRINTTAVCPFDYFSAELKISYKAKYNARINTGAKADGESFCK